MFDIKITYLVSHDFLHGNAEEKVGYLGHKLHNIEDAKRCLQYLKELTSFYKRINSSTLRRERQKLLEDSLKEMKTKEWYSEEFPKYSFMFNGVQIFTFHLTHDVIPLSAEIVFMDPFEEGFAVDL